MAHERLDVSYEIHVLTDDPDGSQRQAQIDAIARLIRRAARTQENPLDEEEHPRKHADT